MIISVSAAIIRNKNRYLIARRSPGKHLEGYWEFPGGKIEQGETAEECLVREIREELGIYIWVESFFGENLFHYDTKSVLLKAFICKRISGEITLIDHDLCEWVTAEKMNEYLIAPADIPFVQQLQGKQYD